jgi:hypothetical protein
MGNQDSIHILTGQIKTMKPRLHTFSTDSSVNQNMALTGSYINTVAAASAGNTLKSHKRKNPTLL